jgi:hypothetical protein
MERIKNGEKVRNLAGEGNPAVDVLDWIAATLKLLLADLFAEIEEGVAPNPALPRGRKSS